MIEVIKNVFVEMANNINIDFDQDTTEILANAFFNANSEVMNIRLITNEVLNLIKDNDLEMFYDLDEFYLITDQDFDKLIKIDRVFRIYAEQCEGVEVKMIKLVDSFSRSFFDVYNEI